MNNPLSYLLLIIIVITAFYVFWKIPKINLSSKRKRLSSYLKTESLDERSAYSKFLEKYKLSQYFDPAYTIQTAQDYGSDMTKTSYVLNFIFGVSIAVIIMNIYFRPILFMFPVVVIGGFIAVNIRLHKIKKEYVQDIDEKLSIYMSSLVTALETFGNLKQSLVSIMALIDDPIRSDLEQVQIKLQDGKSVTYAFEHMNQKYPNKDLKMFHEQLHVVNEVGMTDLKQIRSTANRMKERKEMKRELKTAHKQSFKMWKAFVFLNLSLPFLFLILSTENFFIVLNHIASTFVYTVIFILIMYTYRKLEFLEMYDPTEDTNADFKL